MPRPILSNESVRLIRELPELCLQPGTVGVVRSAWFYPTTAYEVEFPCRGRSLATRILLLEGEVAPVGVEMQPAANDLICMAPLNN